MNNMDLGVHFSEDAHTMVPIKLEHNPGFERSSEIMDPMGLIAQYVILYY